MRVLSSTSGNFVLDLFFAAFGLGFLKHNAKEKIV